MSGRRARWALGMAVLGRPAYINTGPAPTEDRSVYGLQANAFDVLDAAAAAGIDWIDCARSYGLAERFLGAWFAQRRPDPAPTVSSKWGYAYVGEWRRDADVHEVKEHTLARLTEQWDQTCAELPGLVGLYQIHSLTADSPVFTDRALLGALAGLVAKGVAVGFSTSGPGQAETIRRAVDVTADGRGLFSGVQATWNLLEPTAGAALAEASEAGMTVLVKEALANGRLVTEDLPALARVAERVGAERDAVALSAAVARPWADRIVLGSATVDQLAANLQADLVRLTDEDVADLASLATPSEQYWATRSDLAWR